MSVRARPVVAIDGPAGAGKSTVARGVARALGFVLVDTGALYRTLALAAKEEGIDWTRGADLGELARRLVVERAIVLRGREDRGVLVTLRGRDVSEAIRTPEMGLGASQVSAHPDVRRELLELQRDAGREGGVVLEGRDIGTVVFPDAEVKIFLTARPEVRAQRRFDELLAKGDKTTLEATLSEVLRRDDADSSRAVAPLKQAPDAMLVDTSAMTIEQAIAVIVGRARAPRTP